MAQQIATADKTSNISISVTLSPEEFISRFGAHLSPDQRQRFLSNNDLGEEDVAQVLGHDNWDFVS